VDKLPTVPQVDQISEQHKSKPVQQHRAQQPIMTFCQASDSSQSSVPVAAAWGLFK